MIHHQTKLHNGSNSSLVYSHQQKVKEIFQQYHIITPHSTNKIILHKVASMVYRERKVIAPVILNFGTDGGEWSTSCPGCLTPRKERGTPSRGGWICP